ncbi:MAG: hypothetical protein J5710_11890 [Treponema sp.]|nr:hypothetical protein [Treponema sp.]
MMKKFLISITVLLIFFSTACKSVDLAKAPVTLNGMIYDNQNKPVVNYTICVDGVYCCQSDISGRFVLKDVPKGEHVITGYGDRYLNIKETTVIYDKAQILYIRVLTVEAKLNEAFMYLEQSFFEKAEESVREILLCDEDNTEALFFMTVIKYQEGRIEESLLLLEQLRQKKEGGKYVNGLEKIITEN